jgi:putative oxidoreductase
MKMKSSYSTYGPLFLRLGLALIFLVHGVQKFLYLDQTVAFFKMVGLPPFLSYLIAAIETLSGLALLLGLFTEIASALIVIVMIGAIVTVKGAKGFVGGYEFDLLILLAALSLIFTGPGTWSIKPRR